MGRQGSPRTPEKKAAAIERFLDEMRAAGTVKEASERAGISRSTAYKWRDADPEFAAAWDKAEDAGTDVLEQEARRRALEGSDTLMIFLLKARRPAKYRDKVAVEHSGQISRPSADELATARAAGLDDDMEQALANVASLDAARARKTG